MGVSGGPNMVEDGLVLKLDASDRNSYVSGSFKWNDLSNNNYNFTLNSSISWDPNGYFNLRDNIGLTYSGSIVTNTTCTVVYWMRTTETQALFLEGQSTAYYLGAYRIDNKEYYGNAGTPAAIQFCMDAIDVPNIYDHAIDGKWHMLEFKGANLSPWTFYKFNTYPGYTFANGNLAAMYIYNRSLTAEESLQNYNALRFKFR